LECVEVSAGTGRDASPKQAAAPIIVDQKVTHRGMGMTMSPPQVGHY
jgi:hypothetical protein